jgi:hypothetical protein
MRTQTTDGYVVTTVEQSGEFAGEEIGRVFLLRESGYDYWGFADTAVAERIASTATTLSRQQFEASFNN